MAGLILDPYYRTLDGFQCLIEKEWLSFGHKFTDRCGHIQIGDSKEIAPVFTQFIDAVWQITQQFPNEFEFNENYLFTIHDHVYSCQFGTFIGNCERERNEIDVKNATYSLWAKLDSQREQYINPLYKLSKESKRSFLEVQLFPQLIRFWRSMYNRFDFGIHPRECLTDLLTVTYNHTKSLEGHINYLRSKIDQIKQLKDQKHRFNLIDANLIDKKQQLFTKQNSIESQSIKSFDSINSSLKIVEECMSRLQMKHNQQSTFNYDNDDDDKNDDRKDQKKIDINLIELINSMQSVALDWQNIRNVKKCVCGGSFEQTNFQTTNCWGCGLVYCCRCLEKRIKLPGLLFSENDDQIDMIDNLDQNEQMNRSKKKMINKQTINDELNNQKNEQMNYVQMDERINKFKKHPLEPLEPLERLDESLVQEKINTLNSINNRSLIDQSSVIEQTDENLVNSDGNFKHHPLEILDDDFEPIEVGIDCEKKFVCKNDFMNECQNDCRNDDHNCESNWIAIDEIDKQSIKKNGKTNSIQTSIDQSDLIEIDANQTKSLTYEFVPVCLACYRLIREVKVN